MIKMFVRPLSFIIILSLLIFIVPVSIAADTSYGILTGKALDRNGVPLGNATVNVRDWTGDIKGSTITAENGTFTFDKIPITGFDGRNTFSLLAIYNVSDKSYSDKTEFFWVYKNQVVNHDVTIYYYPPSGHGWLTGKVVNANSLNQYLSATVYINNGMYTFVTGESGDHWQFYLPEGDYTIWAEHNENGKTYSSGTSNVHVRSEDTYSATLGISLANNTTVYRPQPAAGVNVVHGSVVQKNGQPLYGAHIELCRLTGKTLDPVMSTTTGVDGHFVFDNVTISTVMDNYVARLSYYYNGSDKTMISDPFTIYYNNMLNVPHDYSVSMAVDFVDSGSLELITQPLGAHIWIDSEDSGRQTPFNFTGMKVGTHTVSLVMDGYLTENVSVTVAPENTVRATKILKPSTGDVSFMVHPSDASIYVNGDLAGKGQTNMTKLPYGKYAYTISRDGYRNITSTFEVVPGEHLNVPIDLVAVPAFSLTYIGFIIDNIFASIGKLF